MTMKRQHGAHETDVEHSVDTNDDDRPEIFRQRTSHDDELLRVAAHDRAYDRFGGMNPGAAFFGWLCAMGLTVLLAGIVAAVATGLGLDWSRATAEEATGTEGIISAAVLLGVLVLGYFAGGYVAGRMSRFDGGKQGFGVWTLGIVVTLLAAAAGWIAGDQYNVLDRVDLPQVPIPGDQLTMGGVVAGLLILLGTLPAAVLGGKAGHRYHDKVDDEAYSWR